MFILVKGSVSSIGNIAMDPIFFQFKYMYAMANVESGLELTKVPMATTNL